MYRRLICLCLVLALGSCHKSPPLQPTHANTNAPPAINWFDGSVEGAFLVAKRENRPVLLFWGAQWCPFCHTLKSTVFNRPDFIAKTKLFLPVYLDGDDKGAQKWGEQFRIQGYPTLIVLDPEQHEIIRLGAGHDVAQYAAILDLALDNLQPAGTVLQAAAGGKALSANECRRLAYNSWELDPLEQSQYAQRADQLQAAVAQCPGDAVHERADLTIYAAYYASEAQGAAAGASKAPASAQLTALTDQVSAILAQPALAESSAQALEMLDDDFFKAVHSRDKDFASMVRDRYVAAMDAAAADDRYAVADQLGFVDAQLHALRALGGPKFKFPAKAIADANMRIDAALAAEQSQYVRPGLVNASLNILEDVGDYPKAYQIANAEIARSDTPYYYQADLAEIAEKLGHKDEAIGLLDQAYHGSKGAATRFQWGGMYLAGLLRMAPKDATRIQEAGTQVLAELDGSDRIYQRARVRLETLDRQLKAWNDAAKGRHGDVLQALHARMQQICVKIPDKEPERASCDAFLKPA